MKLMIPISIAASCAAIFAAFITNEQQQSEYRFTLTPGGNEPEVGAKPKISEMTNLFRMKETPSPDNESSQELTLVGDWTWPGDGSAESLAEHLEGFHGDDVDGKPMTEMVDTHNEIHDEIGPVSFDQSGNAFGPGIGFVSNNGYASGGFGSSGSYRVNYGSTGGYGSNPKRASYGSQGGSYSAYRKPVDRGIGWRVRRLFGHRGYGSRG